MTEAQGRSDPASEQDELRLAWGERQVQCPSNGGSKNLVSTEVITITIQISPIPPRRKSVMAVHERAVENLPMDILDGPHDRRLLKPREFLLRFVQGSSILADTAILVVAERGPTRRRYRTKLPGRGVTRMHSAAGLLVPGTHRQDSTPLLRPPRGLGKEGTSDHLSPRQRRRSWPRDRSPAHGVYLSSVASCDLSRAGSHLCGNARDLGVETGLSSVRIVSSALLRDRSRLDLIPVAIPQTPYRILSPKRPASLAFFFPSECSAADLIPSTVSRSLHGPGADTP